MKCVQINIVYTMYTTLVKGTEGVGAVYVVCHINFLVLHVRSVQVIVLKSNIRKMSSVTMLKHTTYLKKFNDNLQIVL